MATRTIVTCDLHGDETPGRTISFSVERERYAIDLCDMHVEQLNQALAPFEGVARRHAGITGRGAGSRRGGATSSLKVADLSEDEKEFARQNGWTGKRLSNDLIARIEARRG